MSHAPANSSSNSAGSEGGDEALAALRLDALGAGGMDSLTEGVPRKRVPTQVLMLAGLVLVAGASLFVMRKLGMGPVSAVGDVKIDYDTRNAPAAIDHQKVLQDLTASHIEQQVPKEQVQRNPFRIAETLGGPCPLPDIEEDPNSRHAREEQERLERERAERQALLTSTAQSLKIHSILSGSRPIARIGDETVRVGDTLAELFTVKAIHGRSVELEADNQVFVLMMDEAAPPSPGGKPPKKRE